MRDRRDEDTNQVYIYIYALYLLLQIPHPLASQVRTHVSLHLHRGIHLQHACDARALSSREIDPLDELLAKNVAYRHVELLGKNAQA